LIEVEVELTRVVEAANAEAGGEGVLLYSGATNHENEEPHGEERGVNREALCNR
jgi:hypothetical protein